MRQNAIIPVNVRFSRLRRTKKPRKSKIKAPPVKHGKSVEVAYRNLLIEYINAMSKETESIIFHILRQYEREYVNDAYASLLTEAFNNLQERYIAAGELSESVANSLVNNVNNVNKRRFYKSIEQAVGVDYSRIIQNEGLGDILQSATSENVGLIKSISQEYFKKIEHIVYTETMQGSTATSMIEQIQALEGSTKKRAKLIARDQTSKINSALNQQRQQNLGIEEYVWRTSGDERVRETHRKNNKKTFRWDTPPKDTGHPGKDVECRCIAQAIINI